MDLERSRYEGFVFESIKGSAAQADLEALLNRAFGVPRGGSFYDDFPVWDERFALETHRVGVYTFDLAKRILVASASVRIAMMKTARGLTKVGLIGSVVTDEAWRGRGLASQAVVHASDWATSKGAELLLLWGSEHSLYQRLGFELSGAQVRIPLEQIVDAHDPMTQVSLGWVPSLMNPLMRRPEGLQISAGDQTWIEAHKNVAWYWSGPSNAPTAYAAVGKGIDLAGLIHEWGGEKDALLALFAALNHRIPGLEVLGSPGGLRAAGIDTSVFTEEYLCMARATRPEMTVQHYLPIWVWGLDGA